MKKVTIRFFILIILALDFKVFANDDDDGAKPPSDPPKNAV